MLPGVGTPTFFKFYFNYKKKLPRPASSSACSPPLLRRPRCGGGGWPRCRRSEVAVWADTGRAVADLAGVWEGARGRGYDVCFN